MVYLVIVIIAAVLILIGSMRHGFHIGFAREVTNMLSLVGGGLILSLLAALLDRLRSGNTGGIFAGVALLVVFGIVCRILHVLLNSINFIARMPVIHWLDSALGLISGLICGFAILYVLEFLLTGYFL